MKFKLICSAALLPILAVAAPANAQVAGEKIPNSYICVFNKDAVSRGNAQAEANRAGDLFKEEVEAAVLGLKKVEEAMASLGQRVKPLLPT